MTFVKARISIEQMRTGGILEIRLKGTEPRKNVPDSLTELGHRVLSLEPESPAPLPEDRFYRLRVVKTEGRKN